MWYWNVWIINHVCFKWKRENELTPKRCQSANWSNGKHSIHHARSVWKPYDNHTAFNNWKKLYPSAGYPVCATVWQCCALTVYINMYSRPSAIWRHPCLAFYIHFVHVRPFRCWVSGTIRVSVLDCVPFRAFSVPSHICRSHSHSVHPWAIRLGPICRWIVWYDNTMQRARAVRKRYSTNGKSTHGHLFWRRRLETMIFKLQHRCRRVADCSSNEPR